MINKYYIYITYNTLHTLVGIALYTYTYTYSVIIIIQICNRITSIRFVLLLYVYI